MLRFLKLLKRTAFALFFVTTPLQCSFFDVSFDIGAGYRQDNLDWKSSGSEKDIDLASNVYWKNLNIWQIVGNTRVALLNRFYGRAEACYGKVCGGHARVSDFEKGTIFQAIDCNAGKGEVFDLSAAFGYEFFCLAGFKIFPLIGYSLHEQHLRLFDGKIAIDEDDQSFVGLPVHHLHSHYRAKWSGPWTGFDFDFDLDCNLQLFGSGEYHWARYRGQGHWNLREDFVDHFEHRGNSRGKVLRIGLNYQLAPCQVIGVVGKYQIWKLHHGRESIPVHSIIGEMYGLSNNVIENSLENVFWRSYSITVYYGLLF